MVADGNGVDTHFYDGIIVAARLGHVAEIEDILFVDFEFLKEVGHAEDFVHAWSDGVNRGGAADFVVEFGGEFFATGDDLFTFLAIGIPSILFLGAGFLAEGGEGDLGEAIFDDFVARLELVGFPKTEFAGGLLDGCGDFRNLFIGEGIIVDLLPVFGRIGAVGGCVIAIILGALGNK